MSKGIKTSTTLNSKENYGPQAPNKVTLKVIGDLDAMTKGWSPEELHDCRRIVVFRKFLIESTLQISFHTVSSNGEPPPNSFYISCIKEDATGVYYFTEEDIIDLIEWLRSWPSPYRLSAEQKTHILDILENFRPLTVSKIEAETEDLFKLIMGLSNPQPSNLEVDIKVLCWETLLPALKTIIDGDDGIKLPETPTIMHKKVVRTAQRSSVTTDIDHSHQTKSGDWNFSDIGRDKLEIYNSWLADSLFTAVRDVNTDQNARNRVLSILPELLEAFAIRIGHNVPVDMHYNIESFILRNRDKIFTSFQKRYFEQGNPQTTPVPSSDNDNVSISDTVGAWLRNLDLSRTQSEDGRSILPKFNERHDINSANTNIDSAKDDFSKIELSKSRINTLWTPEEELRLKQMRNAGNSWAEIVKWQKDSGATVPQKLQDAADPRFAAYRELILKTEGYQWLLSRLKKELLMAPAKPSFMDTIKNLITQTLLSSLQIGNHTPAKIYNAIFEVDWDIKAFLEKQQYSTELHEAIEKAITVTGSYQDSYVTTCGQYINQTWPSSGSIIMRLIKDMVGSKFKYNSTDDLSTGAEFSARIDGTKFIVTADGPMTSITEAGEQLAWLGAALRTSPHDQGLACCSPFISSQATQPLFAKNTIVKFKIGFRDEIQQDPGGLNGVCWYNLFKNPMVVKGYPIPARAETGTGAEIPFNIMAGLARTQRVDCFKGMTFIKGFSILLVPTKRIGDMIFWHLAYNKDGHRISYLDSNITSLGYANNLDLEQCRHVLGWCEDAAFYAGSAQANYFVANSALPTPHEGCSLVGTYVSPGRCIVGGPTFSLGVKETPIHVSRSGYIPRLQWIATKYVLLWDESEKRGWLVNGTSALLHIFNSAFIFRERNFQESKKPFMADSAIDVLINPKNLALKLYREKHGYLLLESRIEYFYNILEKLIDHQADIAGERGVNMADKPRRYLEGWEFNDLAMSRDPLYPRVASLEPRGKSWVDFTRAIHAVTLFGRGFGDIIKSPGTDICEYWAEMPKQKYYLAACVSDLSQLVKDNHLHQDIQVRVSHDIIWHTPTSLFGTCRCKGILGQDHSDPVQSLLPSAMSNILLPRKIDIPLESPGAVIFGHNSSFSWIYEDCGHPSEGKLPPPNVSDVDSLKDSGIEVDMESPRIDFPRSSTQRSIGPSANRQVETSFPEHVSIPCNETRPQQKYTVGILCALPKELLAVRALFDKKHDNLESLSGDSNHYALGQMGKHMIVASCLPEYGTTSAADSASNMRRSFPNIRFCLMVGIGGGAPSLENDIRLGDVVVSLPTAGYPGVVQYDRGKEKDNNVFELTGSLPPPPRSLMTAISSLRSDPDLASYPLQPYLDEIINRVPESMRSRYKHPGQEHDQLFKAACSKCQSQEECANRDSHIEQRSRRPTNDPEIHYGLIASGNHVIKSSQARDKWAQEHGVLCFEMEAAGIMNIFPSLVIRGICDYADAFKNKLWQEYAAATAAAYAKLLLSVVAAPDNSYDARGLGRRRDSAHEWQDELHNKRRRLE
ncbi:hypothetical protein GGI43DRAFT_423762 [Trichoderma evansii]